MLPESENGIALSLLVHNDTTANQCCRNQCWTGVPFVTCLKMKRPSWDHPRVRQLTKTKDAHSNCLPTFIKFQVYCLPRKLRTEPFGALFCMQQCRELLIFPDNQVVHISSCVSTPETRTCLVLLVNIRGGKTLLGVRFQIVQPHTSRFENKPCS